MLLASPRTRVLLSEGPNEKFLLLRNYEITSLAADPG